MAASSCGAQHHRAGPDSIALDTFWVRGRDRGCLKQALAMTLRYGGLGRAEDFGRACGTVVVRQDGEAMVDVFSQGCSTRHGVNVVLTAAGVGLIAHYSTSVMMHLALLGRDARPGVYEWDLSLCLLVDDAGALRELAKLDGESAVRWVAHVLDEEHVAFAGLGLSRPKYVGAITQPLPAKRGSVEANVFCKWVTGVERQLRALLGEECGANPGRGEWRAGDEERRFEKLFGDKMFSPAVVRPANSPSDGRRP